MRNIDVVGRVTDRSEVPGGKGIEAIGKGPGKGPNAFWVAEFLGGL